MNPDAVIILQWLKPDGATVQVGDAICVVQTPRKTVEVTAEHAGVLRHLVPAGQEQTSEFTPFSIKPVQPPSAWATPVNIDELEKLAVTKALEECGGNRTHAANRLGISFRTLQRKLRQHDLEK